jgi:hypothetical protein
MMAKAISSSRLVTRHTQTAMAICSLPLEMMMTNFDQLRQEIHKELMKSETLYCVYCGQVKHSYGCCGENHFEVYADMYEDDQKYILDETVADELERLAKEKK